MLKCKWNTLNQILVASLFVCSSSYAEVSGSVKTFFLNTEPAELPGITRKDDTSFLGLNRVRLEYRDRLGPARVDIQYDHEIRFGDFLTTDQFHLQQELTPEPYWDAQNTYHQERKLQARHGLYRGTVSLPLGLGSVRVGRQQINWARTFLWSSFDRFNPYVALQLEPDERRGVDGVRWRWDFDDLQNLEIVGVGGHDQNQRGLGALLRAHFGNTDVDFLVADFGAVRTAGMAGAGQIGNIGWRGELTINRDQNNNESFNEVIASLDYTFATQTTVVAEVLYRGDGQSQPRHYDVLSLLGGARTNLAKRYVGIIMRQSIQSTTEFDLTLLHNFDDNSTALMPVVEYSPGRYEDIQLRLGFLLFSGDSLSEYGAQNTLTFGELQWFF